MRTFLRVWAVVALVVAVWSEYIHCRVLDTPEHPRPTGRDVWWKTTFLGCGFIAIAVLTVT